MDRRFFIRTTGLSGASVLLFSGCEFFAPKDENIYTAFGGVEIKKIRQGEDIFKYIKRLNGNFDLTLYKQILGAANEFKEGDQTLKIAAANDSSRINAKKLLGNTKIEELTKQSVYTDDISILIAQTTASNKTVTNWTMEELKSFVLMNQEVSIKEIMPSLSSDIIAFLVKIMTNEELILLSQKVFNPLPNCKIGSKGYMGARVQPNSPTDNIEDISWQVFNAWSFAVGDVVLGTNPVSGEQESISKIENTLFDIISSFELNETIPNCVLSHIDLQAKVEEANPGKTGIWFQSLASTVKANKTFDVTVDKMLKYASLRNGQYGFYAETGQGADFTNGHGEGFDMVIHESRKYGFLRALKLRINTLVKDNNSWVHVNDVAGFIGPEVFKTKEQLVRCCLEDIVMGKLHGLTIGLDICSTLHMDVNLEDLDWCIDEVMPANPAYLMALPTKNDPMLSYLTTSFSNHVKIREQFGYKVNDSMWDFFKKLEIIDAQGNPTKYFGDPIWVYYKYRKTKHDNRSLEEIYHEGKDCITRIEKRGVPIAQGYGKNIWDLEPKLDKKMHHLYDDAKISLWTELDTKFIQNIPASVLIKTQSTDRKDYVYHPETGERLNLESIEKINKINASWNHDIPDIQLVISDGLNARALMDDGHLFPYLAGLTKVLKNKGYSLGSKNLIMSNGRVRAGYTCGELLFGQKLNSEKKHGIIHLIGERPGSGHHNFSAYITVAKSSTWQTKGLVDHNITKVVSGISDTSLSPLKAIELTEKIISELF